MASCQTSRWAGTSPYVKLVVTENESTSTETVSKLDWSLYYISNYAAQTSSARAYTVTINGTNQKSGSYNINGVTGTKLIASGTTSVNKGDSARSVSFSVSFAFNLTWSGTYKGTLSASSSVTVSAKQSYTITYNANGGSSAPGKQTKVYGTNVTLSTGKPTRAGYIFKGWATTSGGAVAYQPGGTYSSNANITLYAVWQQSTFTVTYNANGGTGAPSNQTKTYGTNLTLSSTKPTKTDYKFEGWGTSSSDTTPKYQPGGIYTANAGITLYAIWTLDYEKPRITNLIVNRCNLALSPNGLPILEQKDDGKYGVVQFEWNTDKVISFINIAFKLSTATAWSSANSYDVDLDNSTSNVVVSDDRKSGSVLTTLMSQDGSGNTSAIDLGADFTYYVKITVADSSGQTTMLRFLNGTVYPIDFLNGTDATGTAIGKAATLPNTFEIAWPTKFTGGIKNEVLSQESDLDNIMTPNTYASLNVGANTYTNLPSGVTSDTFTLEVISAGDAGQVLQKLTTCSKTGSTSYIRFYYDGEWGNWIKNIDTNTANLTYQKKHSQKTLWTGSWHMNGDHRVQLSEKISDQDHGIVLSFSRFDNDLNIPLDYAWNNFFIPSHFVNDHDGQGVSFMMIQAVNPFDYIASKYLYISDQIISGHAKNTENGSNNGITYKNSEFVLRAVYGV